MGNRKISQFTEVQSASTSSFLTIVDNGVNYKITKENFLSGLTNNNVTTQVIQDNVFKPLEVELQTLGITLHSQVTKEIVANYISNLNINIGETELLLLDIIDNIPLPAQGLQIIDLTNNQPSK